MKPIDYILNLFATHGSNAYVGEPVSQLDHAIQTAIAGVRYGAREHLICAALLHDIGHLMHPYHEDCAEDNIDSQHELIGENYCRTYFNNEVAELIKQHVNAKRYLTAINKRYLSNLSSASLHSLTLQGGPMQAAEISKFESHPLYADILLLRKWDEGAKIPNKALPDLSEFIPYLQKSLKHV